MAKELFQIGDTVKLKTWEEMEQEYELIIIDSYLPGMKNVKCIAFPSGVQLSFKQEACIRIRCPERIDTIVRVFEDTRWYELQKCRMIIHEDVVKSIFLYKEFDEENNRFYFLDFDNA